MQQTTGRKNNSENKHLEYQLKSGNKAKVANKELQSSKMSQKRKPQ